MKPFTILSAAIAAALAAPGVTYSQRVDLATDPRVRRIDGFEASANFGESTSRAGDVNGDGIDDIIVGAPGASPSGRSDAGEVFVLFGRRDASSFTLDPTSFSGFRLFASTPDLGVGRHVAGGGDINGDGLSDIAISGATSNTVYIVFGKASLDPVDLEQLSDEGFRIEGSPGGNLGDVAVSRDFNGDGLDDIVLGAYVPGSGNEAYIVFGTPDTTDQTIGAGIRIVSADSFDAIGASVSGAGDVNGDGLGDVVIGIPESSRPGETFAGEACIIFGRTSSDTIQIDTLGEDGFCLYGAERADRVGQSVADAGDVNGDGLNDILVASPSISAGNEAEAYVIFGKATTDIIRATSLSGAGFRIENMDVGDLFRTTVASAGDINDDGLSDLLLGSRFADVDQASSAGRAYIVFGKSTSTPISLNQPGSWGFRIDGENGSDLTGVSVAGALDFNGDGSDDVIIGSLANQGGLVNAGRVYVLLGEGALPERVPLPPGLDAGDLLGNATAIDGTRFVLGIPRGGPDGRGQIAIYRRDGDSSILEALIDAPESMTGGFGGAVAIEGDRILVGAGASQATQKGSALRAALLQRLGQDWRLVKELAPAGPSADGFGAAVALSGDMLVVGAPGESEGQGAAYVFSATGAEQARFTAQGSAVGFGAAVAADKGRIAIGAPGSPIGGALAGSVTLIDQIAANLSGPRISNPVTPAGVIEGDRFGSAVSLDGESLAVGAPASDLGRGAAYRFALDANTFGPADRLVPQGLPGGAAFGAAVALGGNTLAIGAPGLDGAGAVFQMIGDAGNLARLDPSIAAEGFGSAIALSDNGDLVVGAPATAQERGAALAFFNNAQLFGDGFE